MDKEYKGHDIYFDERLEEWYCGELRDASYKALCVKIDKHLSHEWKRKDAYYRIYSNSALRACTVTSLLANKREAWITMQDDPKQRCKVYLESLYEFTPENVAVAERIITNHEAIKMLQSEINELVTQLTPFRG